ncbi:MAG: ATP-binding cassette domain-containing protein [Actinomycetota bacterium]|nr:ATP-binding cassette domain-containing protein [Actinomycetota bacterium]
MIDEARLARAIDQGEIIRTEALSKTYPGGLRAVDGLDLAVGQGEVFGLLGPNGAGKTTTIGMLTTRVVPTSGRATVGGIDVAAEPTLAKQLIGVVPQTNTLDRSLSVSGNLYRHGRYFGMSARAARAAVDESLERFRLTGRATAAVHTLSGGMARRLMLARAVLHRPAVVFLDEPSAGLDPQSRLALWEIIGELFAAGHTILVTTHSMEEADRLCHRVAIMDHGRILALGPPEALKASLGTGGSASVRADGDLDALARHLGTVAGVRHAVRVDGLVRLHLDSAHSPLPRIVAAAERAGFTVTDLSVTKTTLETVFISLTGKELRE